MKGSWKLCVASGSLLVFAVLGVLVLLGHSVSSADSEKKVFQTAQGVSGESIQATGAAVDTQKNAEDKNAKAKDSNPGAEGKDTKQGADKGEKKEVTENCSSDIADGAESTTDYLFELAAGQDVGSGIAWFARQLVGVRYVYGGTKLPNIDLDSKEISGDKYGVDSSGFVMKVFEYFQIKLPRSCKEQAEKGKEIKVKDIMPGDIIFYGAGDAKVTHCGIYAGDGKVVHASSQKKAVTLSNMNYRRIAKVKRVYENEN